MSVNATAFEYGAELQGRGEATTKDIVVGSLMLFLASSAVILGIVNLILIRKMEIFRNAFGWFWASRTVGEVLTNVLHVCYSAPVTILQPKGIPAIIPTTLFLLGYFGALGSCLMHQVVSINRCIAVCFPISYHRIFAKEHCVKIIIAVWAFVPLVVACFVVFPCNLIGYSPQLYEYAFLKCSANMTRESSVVGTLVNRICACLCVGTVFTDMITFCRIVYIRKVLKQGAHNADLNRNIRFFVQSTVQNFTMLIAVWMIVVANNEYHLEHEVIHILGFNMLLITHVNNALALIIFNPEVRNRIMRRSRNDSTSGVRSVSNVQTVHIKS